MKIHFCDICNESVPETDLAAGGAYVRKGRVVCATCDAAMTRADEQRDQEHQAKSDSTESPAEKGSGEATNSESGSAPDPLPDTADRGSDRSSASSGSLFAVAVASIAILVSGGAAMLLAERIRNVERGAVRGMSDVRGDLDYRANLLESDLRAARDAGLENLEFVQEELLALRGEMLDGASERKAQISALRSDLDETVVRLGEIDSIAEKVSAGGEEVNALRHSLAELRVDLQAVAGRVAEIEAGAVLSVPLAEIRPEGPPPWAGLVDELASSNAGSRWNAVQALGETGDSAVVPHLVPMLSDPDIFVRMATARMLGDLRAITAIPALIETLNDHEASVREAAVVTLRALSGHNLRFDPSASESERNRRIQAWEQWWEKNAAELAGESA